MGREYGSLAKQVFESIAQEWEEQYIWQELHTLHSEFNRKKTLFAKRVRTNVGRATAKTYNGDCHFRNVRYQ